MNRNKIALLQNEKAAAIATMQHLRDRLVAENRGNLTVAEDSEFEAANKVAERCNAELKPLLAAREQQKNLPTVEDINQNATNRSWAMANNNGNFRGANTQLATEPQAVEKWIDAATGDPIEVLSYGEKLTDHRGISGSPPLHLGRLIKGIICSKWDDNSTPERQLLAQGGSVNAAGGVLVNDELSTGFIDKVRAAMVCLRAGAKTVKLNSDLLRIARVTTDPTFTIKAENDAFPSAQVAFDGIQLVPRTIGAVVALSRELLEDAVNAVDLIESVMAKALAVKLDQFALSGTGSAQPLGLTNFPNITATGSIGTLAWSNLQTAATAIRNANIEPNCYVCSPTNQNRLASFTTGDGVNSAKMWLPPPANIAPLEQYVTTSMADGTIAMGDFTAMLFGVRSEIRLEFSTEAGTAFVNHQALCKITTRWDVNFEHTESFYLLTGITG